MQVKHYFNYERTCHVIKIASENNKSITAFERKFGLNTEDLKLTFKNKITRNKHELIINPERIHFDDYSNHQILSANDRIKEIENFDAI